jgi:tetratricopeptide (TPR) repeat protein
MLRAVPVEGVQRHEQLRLTFNKTTALVGKEKVQACRYLGELCLALQEHDFALVAYDAAIEIEPRDCLALIGRGDVLFLRNAYAKALDDYTKAIESGAPDDPGTQALLPYIRRGFTYCRLERFDDALSDFRVAYAITPLRSIAAIAAGFSKGGLTSGARDQRIRDGVFTLCDLAIEQHPHSGEAFVSAAHIAAEFGDFNRASRNFETAAAIGGRSSALLYRLAELALARGDYTRHRQICHELIERYAATDDVQTSQDVLYPCFVVPNALEDYGPAVALARRVLQKTPGNGRVSFALGGILLRSGQYEEARVHLLSGIESTVDEQGAPIQGPYLLAIAHHHLGEPGQAQHWLHRGNQYPKERVLTRKNWRFRMNVELLTQEATQLIAPTVPEL